MRFHEKICMMKNYYHIILHTYCVFYALLYLGRVPRKYFIYVPCNEFPKKKKSSYQSCEIYKKPDKNHPSVHSLVRVYAVYIFSNYKISGIHFHHI